MKSATTDKRAQKTCAALEKAFIELMQQEDLKKITITKVTEKANTNRSTFYLHYYDIYDLLDSVENKIISEICSLIPISDNGSQSGLHIEPLLSYIKSNEKIFQIILKNNNVFNFFDKLNLHFEEKIVKQFFNKSYYDSEQSQYLNRFFVGGTVAIIKNWLENGVDSFSYEKLAKAIEYIAATFIQAFDARLNS